MTKKAEGNSSTSKLLLFVCEIEMNTSSPVLEQLSYSMLLFI